MNYPLDLGPAIEPGHGAEPKLRSGSKFGVLTVSFFALVLRFMDSRYSPTQ